MCIFSLSKLQAFVWRGSRCGGNTQQALVQARSNGYLYVARKGEIIIVEDMHEHPLLRRRPRIGPARSLAPLKVGDKILGDASIALDFGRIHTLRIRLLSLLSDQGLWPYPMPACIR